MKINEIKNSTVDYDLREIAYWTSKGIEIEGKTYPIENFSIKDTGLFATIVLGNGQFSEHLIANTSAKGDQGVAGKDFSIAETFPSVASMSGEGLTTGDFVMISSTVEDPDNAKLYLWNGTEFTFITDMSGAIGVKGLTGERGPQGIQGIQGERGEHGEQGLQGIQGVAGKDFSIAETFPSVASMSGEGLTTGDFVMISSTVEDPDNAKLYLWNGAEFTFVTDMSGATGIKGDTGEQGIQGEQGIKGDTGPQGIQGIQGIKGDTGEQGIQGVQGVAGKDGKDAVINVVTQAAYNALPDKTGVYFIGG